MVPVPPMFFFPYEMSKRSTVHFTDADYLHSDFSLDSALHCIPTESSTEWRNAVGVLVKSLIDLEKVVKSWMFVAS